MAQNSKTKQAITLKPGDFPEDVLAKLWILDLSI